jgi:hypothetical protein
MKSSFAEAKGEVTELLERVTEMDSRLTGRIDSLNYTILLVGGCLFAALVGLIAAILGLIVTQL